MSPKTRALLLRVGAVLGATLTVFALFLLLGVPRPGEHDIFVPRWPEVIRISGLTRLELVSFGLRLLLLGGGLLLLAKAWRGARLPLPSVRMSAAGAALLVTLAALFAFQGFPIVDDEATYLMQADLLARGKLADLPVPPALQWHREPFTIFTPLATTGKYLFGGPLVLVPGVWAGFPPLLHVVFAAMTVLLIAGGLRSAGASELTQRWTALLLALSPMFLLTQATLQSQAPALFGLAVLVWGLQRGDFRSGLVAGLGLGLCASARPQVALPCLAVLVLRYGWIRRRFFLGAAFTALPWAALILAYNHAITGDALTLPGAFYSSERYGFGAFGDEPPHTPLRGLVIAAITSVRLNGWALGWPVSLLGVIVWLARGRPERAAVAPWGWITLATFLFQLGYYFAGITDTGPVYYYAALPFLVAASGAALAEAPAGALWSRVAVVSLLVGTPSFLLEHALRLRRLTTVIAAPVRAVTSQQPALVFLERSLVGSDPRGQVRGVPLRRRGPDEHTVYYPRPTSMAAVETIRARWPDRACRYVFFEQEAASWMVTGCDELPARGRAFDAAEPPWF